MCISFSITKIKKNDIMFSCFKYIWIPLTELRKLSIVLLNPNLHFDYFNEGNIDQL